MHDPWPRELLNFTCSCWKPLMACNNNNMKLLPTPLFLHFLVLTSLHPSTFYAVLIRDIGRGILCYITSERRDILYHVCPTEGAYWHYPSPSLSLLSQISLYNNHHNYTYGMTTLLKLQASPQTVKTFWECTPADWHRKVGIYGIHDGFSQDPLSSRETSCMKPLIRLGREERPWTSYYKQSSKNKFLPLCIYIQNTISFLISRVRKVSILP